jgi:hypothetical protein
MLCSLVCGKTQYSISYNRNQSYPRLLRFRIKYANISGILIIKAVFNRYMQNFKATKGRLYYYFKATKRAAYIMSGLTIEN